MKAIRVRYLPATDTKGARLRADDGDGNSAVVGYPHAERDEDKHLVAVRALCAKMGWQGRVVRGMLGTESVYVWIRDDGANVVQV